MHSCFALVHYFPVMHSDSCNNMIVIHVLSSRDVINYEAEVQTVSYNSQAAILRNHSVT